MIAPKRAATGLGVGILDLATEYVDSNQGLTKPYQNISDWTRTGLFLIGCFADNIMPGSRHTPLLQDIAVAEGSNTVRSVYRAVKGVFPAGLLAGPAGSIRMVRAGQGYSATPTQAIAPPAIAPGKMYRSFVPG